MAPVNNKLNVVDKHNNNMHEKIIYKLVLSR